MPSFHFLDCENGRGGKNDGGDSAAPFCGCSFCHARTNGDINLDIEQAREICNAADASKKLHELAAGIISQKAFAELLKSCDFYTGQHTVDRPQLVDFAHFHYSTGVTAVCCCDYLAALHQECNYSLEGK